MRIKNKKTQYILTNFVNMFLLSVITGVFAGTVVTLYNICADLGEDCAVRLYSLVFAQPGYIPILLLGLAAGGIVIGVAVRFVPMIRGSGLPQTEGAARGLIRFKWYVTMCSMFAASLACIFMGLSAGSEGPSLQIGGCAGSGVAEIMKRSRMTKRLQIASGASAGLAVAFNAPITGLVFSLEEAFRSFSPQVFVCAALSVVCALLTRNAMYTPICGKPVGFSFGTFTFNAFDPLSCLWVALAALIVALLGVAFYHLVFTAKRLFSHIGFLKGTGKFIIPFVLAGAFGLVTVYATGGGHSFIEALGGLDASSAISVLGAPLVASLIIIVVLRFAAAVLNMGCGLPCGVFIPMLAIGAGAGAILSLIFQKLGMGAEYSDYLILICMAAFFTCVVKAPITGLVMIFELTGQFVNLMPALLGVAIGYLVSFVFRTEPIYEKCLDMYIEEERIYEKIKKEIVTVQIRPDTRADGEKIREIIWPTNGLVLEVIHEDGARNVADGETILHANQSIVFECETDDREELLEYLYSIVGTPPQNGD